jgi:hypothetical protein
LGQPGAGVTSEHRHHDHAGVTSDHHDHAGVTSDRHDHAGVTSDHPDQP